MHAVTAGPEDGTPVLLLHGFPEFWYGWRKQIPALAAAGNRVIALDQRGFNLSGKPAGVKNYHIAKLTADVGAVLDTSVMHRHTSSGMTSGRWSGGRWG